MRPLVFLATAVALAAFATPAAANPKVLPFSYGTSTVAPGDLEIEQYIDIAPVRVARELPDGTSEAVTTPRYQLQTELEVGITDRLELGFYTMFRQGASADNPTLRFAGLKERARYRISDPACWPIGVGVYVEFAQLSDELEFEQKILLDKRLGRLTVQANLWIEQEWYWIADETKYIFNPTLGAAWEVNPSITIGGEYWARGRFDEPTNATGEDDAGTTRHFLGPTVMLQKGEYWLSAGAYARLDKLGESASVGDSYGKAFVRVIFGIGL
jgi:hypothetical protein